MTSNDFPFRPRMVNGRGDATIRRVIGRAILELLSSDIEICESEIANRLFSGGVNFLIDRLVSMSISTARKNDLIGFGRYPGNLKITQKGTERLEDLIFQDRTRDTRAVANDALADILAEMEITA